MARAHVLADAGSHFLDQTVGDLLDAAVAAAPDQLALITPPLPDGTLERTWTYQELKNSAEQVARALLSRFEPGSHVATFATGSAEIVLLHLGAALADIVLVTLNPANRTQELHYLLHQSRARGLFTTRSFRGLDNEALVNELTPELPNLELVVYLEEWDAFLADAPPTELPKVAPDAPALILFTSGTTGKPKPAILRQAGIANNAHQTTSRIGLPAHSIWLNVLPMFHVGGSVTMTLGCLSNQGTQVLMGEFDRDLMLSSLDRYDVRLTMAVPTMLVAMMQSPRFGETDLSALEVVVTGGTVVPPELVREVGEKMDVEMMVMFGQTEAGGAMCLTRRGDDVDRVCGSVGAPLDLVEARIVDPDSGKVLERTQQGEIQVITPCRMREYFEMPDKTAETIDAAGWVHTGDLGVMRPDGYLQVTGRLKDMIIRGGENIYPREIEDVLAEHPAVAQAAIFGVPDPRWGENVSAAIVLRKGEQAAPDDLILFLRDRIARHKIPKAWDFRDELPINASGKVMKFVLRDECVERGEGFG